MTRWRTATIGILFSFAPALLGQTGSTAPAQRMTAPQVVVGPSISSDFVLLNSADTTCNLRLNFHFGNGNSAPDPLLINGQNLGNPFTLDIPPWGSQTLRVTSQSTQPFQGATSIDLQTAACIDAIRAQIQYRIVTGEGQLNELFSYPLPPPVPLNGCAAAPVNFDPDPMDGQTNIPGMANVSVDPLSGVVRTMTLFDSQGNPIATRPPETYNGQHDARLLTEFFPGQTGFSGSWKVCFEGQQPPSAAEPTKIDTLFIDVVQTPDIIQFDSNDHALENPDCLPDSQTLCLNDNRFRVNVRWRIPTLGDQPGFVRDIQPDDTGEFVFLDPDNTELLIKVLDGCGFNDHFWVFYGATTNVEYTLTVTDTQTDTTQTFPSSRQPFDAITDTSAFATCP